MIYFSVNFNIHLKTLYLTKQLEFFLVIYNLVDFSFHIDEISLFLSLKKQKSKRVKIKIKKTKTKYRDEVLFLIKIIF